MEKIGCNFDVSTYENSKIPMFVFPKHSFNYSFFSDKIKINKLFNRSMNI